MRRVLSSISVVVPALPGEGPSLAERIREAVEEAGLTAFVRAEGYAFMPSEAVGRLGLPHLRLALVGDRISLWVRDPHKLGLGPFGAEEIYQGIMRAVRAAASVVEDYCSERGIEAIIEVPRPTRL